MKGTPVRTITIAVVFALGIAVYWAGAVLRDTRMQEIRSGERLGSKETCLDCHGDMQGFSPFHDPEIIGCASCHLGNPRAKKKKASHRNMVLIPGNLSNVYQTCGTADCHQSIAQRVEHSLMTTMAGVITVDRFAFGEIDTLSAYAHIAELGHSPADQHLRHLCASCHLGNEKTEFGPISERSRGGGCNACHLPSFAKASAGKPSVTSATAGKPSVTSAKADESAVALAKADHPAITLAVSNTACFGCHSRSGRISLGYEGWHETLLTREEAKGQEQYRVLEDGRVLRQISPDVHHQGGLECIDCHNAREVMGDGHIYLHEEDAVKVRCGDCHFSGRPKTVAQGKVGEEDRKIMEIRELRPSGQSILVGGESGEILWNVWVGADAKPILIGKNNGKKHPLKPPASVCTKGKGHEDLSCGACHTSWAPQCLGCHTSYDKTVTAFDLLDRKKTSGKWEEYVGGFFADPPVLGVVESMEMSPEKVRAIKTFIPGMIMSLDQSGFPGAESRGETFHRLYAPVAPHTTSATGRTCTSCHNDPLAIGYGRGKLVYEVLGPKGAWSFIPEYTSSPDGLPQDAWIGFLQEPKGRSTTRSNARPFTLEEQKRILTVGACLTCHAGNSAIMLRGLEDFPSVLKQASQECGIPYFR